MRSHPATAPAPSPAQGESTRRAILRAAEELLLLLGPERLTVRRLCKECGFTAPTVYHHFGDKQGLLTELLETRFQLLLARLQAVPEPADPVAYWRALGRAFLEFGIENPRYYQLMSSAAHDSPTPSQEAARNLVRSALERAAEATRMPIATETAFQASWAMLHGLITLFTTRPGHPWTPELVETALDTIEKGLLCRS